MDEQPGEQRRKGVALTKRDIAALCALACHQVMTSSQFARMCFAEISYETARKRLRRFQQAGLTGMFPGERVEGRGRAELLYYLTPAGAFALRPHYGDGVPVPHGPPHAYSKEHLLKLVDAHLAMRQAEKKHIICELDWSPAWLFQSDAKLGSATKHADAVVELRHASNTMRALLVLDTGNFRQTRHWEPRMKAFLQTGLKIIVLADSVERISRLREWTLPLLQHAQTGPDRCTFLLCGEIGGQLAEKIGT